MNTSTTVLLSQFITLAPTLIVYIGGIIVVVIWWRRAPRAAMLAMVGLGIMLLSAVVFPIVQMFLVNNRGTGSMPNFAQTMSILGLVVSIVRAVGLGFLIAAVFAERAPMASGFDVHPGPSLPPMAGIAEPYRRH